MRNVHSIILFAVLTFTSFGAEALPGAGHGNLEALPGMAPYVLNDCHSQPFASAIEDADQP